MIDVLHCVDLGVFAHIVANIFWEVISLALWGTTQEANVQELGKIMKAHYKRRNTGNRFRGKFTKDRIKTKGGWPKLKGNAAIVRGLAPFALELAQEYLDNKRVWMCQFMCRFFDILDNEPLFLSSRAKEEIIEVGSTLSELYADLMTAAFNSRIRAWKGSPKLHLFQHLCEWQAQEMGNPRHFWCYADEDMVGKMILTAQSCHPRTLHLLTLWKWLLGYFEQELEGE